MIFLKFMNKEHDYKFPRKMLKIKESQGTETVDTANLDRFLITKRTTRFKVKKKEN